MAKVRVYELARELDIESKKLVDKLIAGGMNIKNYMSTLDEEAASRAREIVSGVVSEVIEEQRVRPTVIRRRKKIKIQQESPEEKAKKESEEPPESPEAAETGETPAEMEDKVILQVKPLEEPVKEMVREEPPAEIEGQEEFSVSAEAEEIPVSRARTEKEEAIKDADTAAEAELMEEKKLSEAVPEKKIESPDESIGRRRKVKGKSDQPAKVIKRPEEGPLKDLLAKGTEKEMEVLELPSQPVEAEEILAVEPIEVADKAKPAKKKKEKKKAEIKEEIPKSFVRRRRKEIYERDDLYKGRPLKPKDKKGVKKVKEAVKGQKQTEITVPRASKRGLRFPVW